MASDPIAELVTQLSKLPGIGEKTATRLAFHILQASPEYAERLSLAIVDVKAQISLCRVCCNLTQANPCSLCTSAKRHDETICVVESPQDVVAIEATGEFRGLYHVLHGVISPLDGKGPDDLRLKELIGRLGDGRIKEVIVATNPSVEGEATALYIKRLVVPLDIRVTRIASGIPIGSHLEYADRVTLGRSIADRRLL